MKKHGKICEGKILSVSQKIWLNGCDKSVRVQEYVSKKRKHMNDKYIDSSIGAMERILCTSDGKYTDGLEA